MKFIRSSISLCLSCLARQPFNIAVLLIVIYGAAAVHESMQNSAVWHEPPQLVSGLAFWRFGRSDMICVTPPLVRAVAALPVYIFANPTVSDEYDKPPLAYRTEYVRSIRFVRENLATFQHYLECGRCVGVAFGAIGAVYIWQFAIMLYGVRSAIVATLLWCFCPYVLGHSATIMTDVPVATAGLIAMYHLWCWIKNRRISDAIATGLAIGVAILCKLSGVVFIIIAFVACCTIIIAHVLSRKSLASSAMHSVVILLIPCVVINVAYGFSQTCLPLSSFRFNASILHKVDLAPQDDGFVDSWANRFAGTTLGHLVVPFPKEFIVGIDQQCTDFDRGLPSYLCGVWSERGWWYYYLFALSIKLPVGTLMLFIMACYIIVRCRDGTRSGVEFFVISIFIFIIIGLSYNSGFSVHSRYAIPAIPYMALIASKPFSKHARSICVMNKIYMQFFAYVLVIYSMCSVVMQYPHTISYCNEAFGGATRGPLYLADSNTDWGQDILFLAKWLRSHPSVSLNGVACLSSLPLDTFGITAVLPPTLQKGKDFKNNNCPAPGWYAISSGYLFDKSGQYSYFLRLNPVAKIGYTINVYHIGDADVRSLCGSNDEQGDKATQPLGDGKELGVSGYKYALVTECREIVGA